MRAANQQIQLQCPLNLFPGRITCFVQPLR